MVMTVRADQRRIVALMALVKLVTTADFAIVSIAIPSIGRSFGAGPAMLSWIVTANTLVLAGTLILGGKLVDRIGQRRALVAGILLFAAGSAAAGAAPSLALVLAARVAQAFAVALLSPAAFSLITVLLPEGEPRHRAMGVFGVTQGFSLILGLLAGGALVTTFGWRAAFFVNLPLLAVALVMALRWVPRGLVHGAVEALDHLGAALLTTALVLFVGAVVLFGKGVAVGLTLSMVAGAVAAAVAFALVERRVPAPLVPPVLFASPLYALSVWLLLLVLAGVGGLMLLTQLYLQRVAGFSAAQAGLGAMPYAVAVILAGRAAPALLARFRPIAIARGAALLNLAGLVWLALSIGQPYALGIAPGMAVAATGSVTCFIALMHGALATLPPERQGLGSAVLFTAQQVGTGLGATLVMMLLESAGPAPDAAAFRAPFLLLAGGMALALLTLLAFARSPRLSPA